MQSFCLFQELLVKDEIKKGSFQLELGTQPNFYTTPLSRITILDKNADTTYKVNSPAGEYGILYATSSTVITNPTAAGTLSLQSALIDQHATDIDGNKYWRAGLIYYQAGV